MQRRSGRLAVQDVRQEELLKKQAEKDRVDALGEPRECREENCFQVARHRGSLCHKCYLAKLIVKVQHPVLCQGCPYILSGHGHNDIRWARDVRPADNTFPLL